MPSSGSRNHILRRPSPACTLCNESTYNPRSVRYAGEANMHVRRILCGVLGAALAGTTLSAQAPASEIDAHISAARAAAGLDYRATFVNLCFSGANPGLANPAVGRAGGARRRSRRAGPRRHPGSRDVVRIAVQGLRQLLLARHATAFVVGVAHERRPHHYRHELRVGHRARDRQRSDHPRTRSPANQIRRHQPCARRSRSGRRRTAKDDSAPRS